MIDINKIRLNPEEIRKNLEKRGCIVTFDDFLNWDNLRRKANTKSDNLRASRRIIDNKVFEASKEENQKDSSLITQSKNIAQELKDLEITISELDVKINAFLNGLPNLLDEDVEFGGKENNQTIRTFKNQRDYEFPAKDHVELAKALNLIDYERGVKLGGNGSWIYQGIGAILEWALLNYFIDTHIKNGYTFILPPHILNYENGFAAGQFPKFNEDVYFLRNSLDASTDNKFLLPTAETALVNLYRDEFIPEEKLPLKLFSYTPCYRSEIGGYRASERGSMRGHQFNKVEMFQYTTKDDSDRALNELLSIAEELVKGLGLHYRITKLAAEDVSSSMVKTFDVEVWIPSIGYKEVSSVSNARDYQARRGNIKYKSKKEKKNHFVHTLNGSGLATSRLLPAILEQYQQSDGSVVIPEVLQNKIGMKILRPR